MIRWLLRFFGVIEFKKTWELPTLYENPDYKEPDRMRKVTITRFETDDLGTRGDLMTDSGFQCCTMEPPWRSNENDFSCIPPGVYKCKKVKSPKHGERYQVLKVKGREGILFHSGNWAGDSKKGFKTHSLGCILPGRAFDKIAGQLAVLSSRDALAGFEADLDGEDFELTVKEKYNVEKS
jgi:hypothetical protein